MAIPFAEGHFCFCGEWCDCVDVICTHCGDDDGDGKGGVMANDAREMLDTLTGMPTEEAEAAIRAAGFRSRRTSIDGQPFVVTRDYRTDRINLAIGGGNVIRAYVG
jgi:hypothetical protein